MVSHEYGAISNMPTGMPPDSIRRSPSAPKTSGGLWPALQNISLPSAESCP